MVRPALLSTDLSVGDRPVKVGSTALNPGTSPSSPREDLSRDTLGKRPADRTETDADPRPVGRPYRRLSSAHEGGDGLGDAQPGNPSIRHAPPATRTLPTAPFLRSALQRGPSPPEATRARRSTLARRTDPPAPRTSTRSTGERSDTDAPRSGATRHARLQKRAPCRRPSASGAKAPPGNRQRAGAGLLRTPLDDTAEAHTPSLTGSDTSSHGAKPHPAA